MSRFFRKNGIIKIIRLIISFKKKGECIFFMHEILMKTGHTIRIFIAAPVRDMYAEREFLTKSVFPKLQSQCREHNIVLEISDPYYGVSENFDIRAHNFRQEIDRSHIIIAFIGEHYGWMPEDSTISLFHEEIDYGILATSETRQLFCKVYQRDVRSCLRVPTEIWTDYWEDDDTDRFQKLAALKEQIRQNRIPIYEYPAQWDEDNSPSWNPEIKGFFYGFENLEETILHDLWQMIQKIVPSAQDLSAKVDPNTIQIPFLEESIFQNSFRKNLTQIFIGRTHILQEIQEFTNKKNESYLIISGHNGIGKSAILAKVAEILENIEPDPNTKQKKTLVLFHNIGLTGKSRDVRCILEWLCKELQSCEEKISNDYAKDFETLRDLFPQMLEQVSEKRKVIIILDGINELYPRYQSYQFYWLPTHIPANASIILSLNSDTYEQILKKRLHAEQFNIPALEASDRRDLILSYCKLRDIEIPEICREELIAKENSDIPLYLKIAIEEVNAVSHQINPIPITEAMRQLPENLPTLLGKILDRWEKQFGYDLVSSFLGTLVVSQNSLPLQRLRTLIKSEGQQYIVNDKWTPLAQSLSPYLFEVQQQVQLSHSLIQDSVYNRYLILDTARLKSHQMFAEFLEKQGYALAATVSELPYHWIKAKNWQKALQLLTNLEFLEAKANAGMIAELSQDIAFFLQECKENISISLDKNFTQVDKPSEITNANEPVEAIIEELPNEDENSQQSNIVVNKTNLEILQRALLADLSFLTRHPQQIFQSLWNRCYWYDSPKSAQHYTYTESKGKKLPWGTTSPIHPVVEYWRTQKQKQNILWLESKRPLEPHLDSPLQQVFHVPLSVSEVAYSRDGKRIAASSWDNCIRIWDLASYACLATLKGHTQWVQSIEFNPNNSELASASRDKTIKIWDIESGKCVKTFKGHTNWVSAVSYSPDGKRLASASFDETVKIWDVGSGQCNKTLRGHKGPITYVVFHPKEEIVASASQDHTIRIWDITTGNCLKVLKGHTDSIEKIAYSPDGKILASASFDRTIRLWNPIPDVSVTGAIGSWFKDNVLKSSNDAIKIINGHEQKVMSVAFSHDGRRLISCSWDRTIRIWQVETAECLLILHGHEDCVMSAKFSPNGKMIASGSQDKTVRIWEIDSSKTLLHLLGHDQNVYAIDFDPEGKTLATASEDKTVGLWDVETGTRTQELKGHEDGILDVVFNPCQPFLATASKDKTVRLWNLISGQSPKVLTGHQDWVRCIAFSPDGKRIASGSSDRTMRIWLIASNGNATCERVCTGHTDYIRAVAFSPDGGLVASGSEDKICRIYRLDGQLINSFDNQPSPISHIEFSDDSQKIRIFTETSFKIWDISTGVCEQTLSLLNGGEIANICQHIYSFNQTTTTLWLPGKNEPIACYHEDLEHPKFHPKTNYWAACGRNNRSYTYLFKL